MSLEIEINGRIIDLNTHYTSNPDLIDPCKDNTDTDWWRFTPYGIVETIRWVLKMLVLPGVITAIIIILTLLSTGRFANLTIGTVYTVLTYIGTVFAYIYLREKALTIYNAIPDDEKSIPDPLNILEGNRRLKIGFVGDIMMMRKYKLEFSDEVKTFFNDVDIILGNLEGIVTDSKRAFTKQAHLKEDFELYQKSILENLQKLLGNKTTWLLCLSNNHSIDFGNNEFNKSLYYIQKQNNINVFGRNETSNVFVTGKEINISTATEWSNQKNWDCISKFDENDIGAYYSPKKFNILYPHWNYENERYVRRKLQKRAKKLLTGNSVKKLDLIFGHHSHVRQDIIKVPDKITVPGRPIVKFWKIIAFSGGNFTSGVNFWRKKKHIHGKIMKCDIGTLKDYPKQLAVDKVEIRDTFNETVEDSDKPTKLVKFGVGETRISKISLLIIGGIILVVIIILRFYGFL